MKAVWIAFGVGLALGIGVTLSLVGRWGAQTPPAPPIPPQLQAIERQLDTLYQVDTVRITRVRRFTDSVLVRRTDTLLHVDTVRVLVEAERAACDAALTTCEARVSNLRDQRDSALAAYDREAVRPKATLQRDAAMAGVGAVVLTLLRLAAGVP